MRRMASIESDYGEARLCQRIADQGTSDACSNDCHVTAAISLEWRRDLADSVAQEPEGVG